MNPKIKIIEDELLSDNWNKLRSITYRYQDRTQEWQTHQREVYDRDNGAVILLYTTESNKILLTRQFRLPTFLNGNRLDGTLIEACAGLLEGDSPEDCIRKEAEEECGIQIERVQRLFEAYMSPGAVTELLYFFAGEYRATMKVGEGGGLAEEQEEIEVLELDFDEAYAMIASGEIRDGKTIMLLQYAKINGLLSSK